VPDLPRELNLNVIKWLNLHDKIICTVFIKCKLYFRKKYLMKLDENLVGYSLT
jgi:hypothetical protein